MTELSTQDLRDRIEDAETRNVGRAAQVAAADGVEHNQHDPNGAFAKANRAVMDAGKRVTGFAKEHPALAIAGGIVAGLAIASMFKGPRKLAAKGGAKAAGLAAIGGEMALAYALEAYEKAQKVGKEGARAIEDIGDSVGDAALKVRREATYRAGTAADHARISTRDATKIMKRKFSRN